MNQRGCHVENIWEGYQIARFVFTFHLFDVQTVRQESVQVLIHLWSCSQAYVIVKYGAGRDETGEVWSREWRTVTLLVLVNQIRYFKPPTKYSRLRNK